MISVLRHLLDWLLDARAFRVLYDDGRVSKCLHLDDARARAATWSGRVLYDASRGHALLGGIPMRTCSICHMEGHNARRCPERETTPRGRAAAKGDTKTVSPGHTSDRKRVLKGAALILGDD
jgi:hypothetical protein